MPHIKMHHAVNPKKVLLDQLGDISEYEIFNTQILVAVYVRPDMTASGIALPKSAIDEDQYQSKVGLIIAMGNDAGEDPSGRWFKGLKRKVSIGDWVIFRPSDGWPITIGTTVCRCFDDNLIKGRVPHPDSIY